MYKYIIYCSVSAAIIIACKYLYQHWIRQNHTIASLKQELGILGDKVKRLEVELERNKNSISGGIKIPIVFKPIENRLITHPASPKVIKLIEDDSEELSANSVKNNFPDVLEKNQTVSHDSSKVSNNSILSHKSQQQVELEVLTANLDKEIENLSQKSEELEQIVIDKTDKVKKTYKKKTSLPDAKDYNNGDRVTDENGVEHICVVGKRGGHSWKKL
jgi:hypothetical protein